MRYLSVCSGIEAATVAWRPLGWECAAVSEIDPHACSVLAHRFPDVPNLGDFTKIGADDVGPVDLVVGGTPCQSFSVAGLRGGLDDDRGNLALEFCRLVDRVRPRWIVWENVPGVFSVDGGQAFRSIIEGFGELGYGVAWRVLDAQYVRVESHSRAVPQRRRRVFAIGYLGDWRPPVAVLLESESLRGDPPPRREAGACVAALTANGVGTCGADDNQAQAGHLVSGAVSAKWQKGTGGPAGDECYNLVAHEHSPALTANPYGDHESRDGLLVAHSLRGEGFDASEDGTGRGTPLVTCQADVAPPVTSSGPPYSRTGNERNEVEALVAFDTTQITSKENRSNPQPGDACHPFTATGDPPSISGYIQPTRDMMVRRLTPRECERLQGFPDDWTLVPHRGKPMSDGPRYKTIGNSMATNVMRLIGERIALFEKVTR